MEKAIALTVFATLALVSLASAAMDWQLTWEVICGDCCVENDSADFTIAVENTGDRVFKVDSVKIELENGTKIATWGSVDNSTQNISVGSSKSFTAKGTLPMMDEDDAYYTACIYAIYLSPDEVTTVREWACTGDYSSLDYVNAADHECYDEGDCAYNQFCSKDVCETECKNLTSEGGCGNFSQHEWVDYECCSDDDCPSNESCMTHVCREISCVCGQVADHRCNEYACCSDADCVNGFCSNHACVQYECSTDSDCASSKICENRLCIELECQGCKYASEHSCKPYECCDDGTCSNTEKCTNHLCVQVQCAFDEYPSGHGCLKYECMESVDCLTAESCINHECSQLACRDDEKVGNHTCLRLSCGFLEYPKRHECVSYFSGEGISDNPLPLGIIIGVLAFVGFVAYTLLKSRPKPGEKIERTGKGRRLHGKPPAKRAVPAAPTPEAPQEPLPQGSLLKVDETKGEAEETAKEPVEEPVSEEPVELPSEPSEPKEFSPSLEATKSELAGLVQKEGKALEDIAEDVKTKPAPKSKKKAKK